jgi:hypothetical protein
MNYRDWKEATYQNSNDPREYNSITRYCQICDIEEEKTYFQEDTSICLDCYEQQQKEEETNENK